jgi:hypothetical protein
MDRSRQIIYFSSIACWIACIGEFAFVFILGQYYTGYNQLKDTMSSLGVSKSPVSDEISLWWIVAGFLFMFFAFGLKKAFSDRGKNSGLAALLVFIYGLGEGIGSGAFKADRIHDTLTLSAIIHDAVGGLGVAAALMLPLVMMKIIPANESGLFHRFSKIIFVFGLIAVALFEFRYVFPESSIAVYKGLWQRLYMLDFYVYLTIVAMIMVRRRNK